LKGINAFDQMDSRVFIYVYSRVLFNRFACILLVDFGFDDI